MMSYPQGARNVDYLGNAIKSAKSFRHRSISLRWHDNTLKSYLPSKLGHELKEACEEAHMHIATCLRCGVATLKPQVTLREPRRVDRPRRQRHEYGGGNNLRVGLLQRRSSQQKLVGIVARGQAPRLRNRHIS